MIKRYEVDSMKLIWDEEKKLEHWLKFQIAVLEALVQLKVMPEKDLKTIQDKVKLDISLMYKLEQETKHDVVAFTRMLTDDLGTEGRWIHFGLTSTDMVDSVLNHQIKLANEIIITKIKSLQNTLKTLAIKYEKQPVMGRSHGIFGEPTSLGLKFALWYAELNRQIERLNLARKQIEVVKITGSMGNFVHIAPEVSEIVAKKIGMDQDVAATQVVQRDRHNFLLTSLANIATTIEKMALEIRLSQRSEVSELLEGFRVGQKGSSSMPHKKNPIGSENICGLARLIRSYASTSYENNLLWYERDISHSSNERVIFPDIYHLLAFILGRMNDILTNLVVNTEKMKENILLAKNIYLSQSVLLTIISNNEKVTREEIYDFMQKCTLEAQSNNQDFKEVLTKNDIKKYLSEEQLKACFDENQFLKNTNYIFNKIFE